MQKICNLFGSSPKIHSQWKTLQNETKLVASNFEIETKLSHGPSLANKKRPRFHDETGL